MQQEKQAKARTGRPRDEATHQAIIDAANGLLQDKGYAAFSIEAVAARAGVAKTSIYRRWPSKGVLLMDLYMAGMAQDALNGSKKSIRDELKAYIDATVQRLKAPGWSTVIRSLIAEAQVDEDLAKLVREKIIEPRRAAGRRLFQSGIKSGELRADIDVEITLDFLFGAIWYRLLLGHAPIDKAFGQKLMNELFERIES